MNPPLRYESIRKRYGEREALRGVSFEVREGEIFGLLGPNGAGKTSLIRIGMDILRPDSGQVSLFGGPLHRDALDRVTYLPEERGLYKKSKVLDVLVYFGRLKGMEASAAREASLRWLEELELAHIARQNVETLSKGMSQKVQIAAALMSDPELCVLDEPFSGLDPVNADTVKRLLRARRERGRTTVLSTHQMNQVEALCDRVAVVNAGELVVYGELEEVRRCHARAHVLVRCEGALPEVDAVDSAEETAEGWRLSLREGAEAADVLEAIVGAGARVTHFEELLATMEQIFLDAVRR